MSIFRRKKSSAKLNPAGAGSLSTGTSPPLPSKGRRNSASQSLASPGGPDERLYVDDFGRPIGERPAFGKEQHGLGFGKGFGVGDDDAPTELQLLYGYQSIETLLELPVQRVEEIVSRCAAEIRARGELLCWGGERRAWWKLTPSFCAGLDTPLMLSSMSLDLTLEGTCSLIRSYLADPQTWAYGALRFKAASA
jgi:hypothetical protein